MMVFENIYNMLTPYDFLYLKEVCFNAGLILFSALFLSLIGNYFFIAQLAHLFCARAREWTPQNHQLKNGTPSMGGLIIISSIAISLMRYWGHNSYTQLFLLCLVSFGIIGGGDDWNKIRAHSGIRAHIKFILQLALAGIITFGLVSIPSFSTQIYVPLFNISYNVGWFFIPWAMFILIGCSNAVNLTDGLDGLAIISLILNFSTYGLIALFQIYSGTGVINMNAGMSVIVIAAAVVGSGIGFLWYNAYPARIIMGDIGALSLGAALGLIALITKQELLLPITGALFVGETLSVILQVGSYRLFKQRLFKMAPIHHHFELIGWPEPKIIMRFSIITLVLCIFAMLICIR